MCLPSLSRSSSEHPHACGENFRSPRERRACFGTSPRVWGKLHDLVCTRPMPRNIPTRVGKTIIRSSCRGLQPEHPHACGENFQTRFDHRPVRGTSPRVWGKQVRQAALPSHHRNIPTRVGKTNNLDGDIDVNAEHPHACGENAPTRGYSVPSIGTSPRVWGKLLLPQVFRLISRNIPTRVGKTGPAPLLESGYSEHPHACGENPAGQMSAYMPVGTSPRVWGKPSPVEVEARPPRNIPTRVGKTSGRTCTRRWTPEHPHACGENNAWTVSATQSRGTSPRVWGKRRKEARSEKVDWNIPTRVGKTSA